jgi:serralysin
MTVYESTHTGLEGCDCNACSGFSDPVDASLDPNAGGTANGKPIWTADQIANYLNRTSGQWGDGFNDMMTKSGDKTVITYGFHENQQSLYDNGYVYAQGNQLFGLAEYFQFGAFTAAQREATREAMSYWDDVLAVTFKETSAYQGDINFGNLTNSPNTQAYSRIPTTGLATTLGGQVAGIAGDVWVSALAASNFQFDEGGYGLNTLVHEVGHSLGLSHPGGYNFGPNFTATYTNGAEYAQDSRNYSIMSYWNPRDMGSTATGVPTRDFDWSLMQIAYGGTPMVHDILAAQKLYGAEMTTRTGDTVYGFNSTADRDAFDFEKTPWPTMAIWDAGGTDTLDASGYGVIQVIDLTPGSLSSIGGITAEEAATQLTFQQINANRAALGLPPVTQATYDANMAAFNADPAWRGRLTDNVGIAYGVTIENAKGGSGFDTIYGNDADNVLDGNAGNDVLEGRVGNDTLNGGTGDDAMKGGVGNDRYTVDTAGDSVVELAGEGRDTVSSSISYTLGDNVEDLILTGAATTGTGNGLDNTITGNALSNQLNGGAGNDRLVGGDGVDYLTGGAGSDVFVAEINATKVASKAGQISLDTVLDFGAGDKVDLSGIDANANVAGDQAFTFVGNAAGKGAGELSMQRFGNMNAAEKALGMDLDGIDGASTHAGPVTVLLGNVDGGDYDFAMAFVGTPTILVSDLML